MPADAEPPAPPADPYAGPADVPPAPADPFGPVRFVPEALTGEPAGPPPAADPYGPDPYATEHYLMPAALRGEAADTPHRTPYEPGKAPWDEAVPPTPHAGDGGGAGGGEGPPPQGGLPLPPPPPAGPPRPDAVLAARPNPVLKLVAVGTAAAVLALSAGVLVDTALGASLTTRRLTLSARDVGRMDDTELRAAVDGLAAEVADRPVTLRAVAGEMAVPAGDLGLTLDRDAVVDAAKAIDHDAPFVLRPLLALRSWFVSQDVPLRFTVDRAKVQEGSADAAAANDRPASEPNIALKGDTFAAVEGVEGQRLDVDGLASELRAVADASPAGPWSVNVPFSPLAPRFTLDDAREIAEQANKVARSPLTVTAGNKKTTVQAAKVRSWLRAVPVDEPGGARLELQADVEAVANDITAAVGTVGTPPTEASFKVVGDRVEVVPGRGGQKCCAPDSGKRVAEAVLAGRSSVNLDLLDLPSKQDKSWTDKLGIVEKVGSFTTRHPGGQPRVTNIHIAADALRGAIVEPGATFSLNGRLGQRTKAKGYVEAGVIYNGVMANDVGGGVSQLTTTLFNAAFFAGMELRSYMSHSIYIDRYPYGREATISYPSPDFTFRNPSPYGLLLWTSYDDTSITVSIFSTKWAVGEQTNQTREPYGPCTRVKTERTRTFVKDGRKVVDYVTAIYQPEEGVQCYGQPNRREDDRPDLKDEGKPNAGGNPGNGNPAPPTTAAPPPSTTKPTTTPPQGASSAQNAVR